MGATEIIFDSVEILEWYDGPVRAIAANEAIRYLVILAAWELTTNQKAYVLLELQPHVSEWFTEFTSNSSLHTDKQMRWDFFNDKFDKFLSQYNGSSQVTFATPRQGDRIQMVAVSVDFIESLKHYDIENVFTKEAIEFWLKACC